MTVSGQSNGGITINIRKSTVSIAVSLAFSSLFFAGCSSYAAAHDHNAATANQDIRPHWRYIDSPGSFQTIIFTCIGHEGYYETQDNSYPIVIIPVDPLCGGKPGVREVTAFPGINGGVR